MVTAGCASCHGVNLRGGVAPNLITGVLKYVTDDESMVKVVRDGVPGTTMPAWGALIGEPDIRSIVTYIREQQALARSAK